MAELKTKENDSNVKKFIDSIDDTQTKEDAFKILSIFKEVTKEKPKMWGSSIIGFGKYHYKSERSRQEGDWPLTGFSPRKQAFSLYLMCGFQAHEKTLKNLGKHKISSGSCLYIKNLEDVDIKVLKKLLKDSFKEAKKKLLK